jgi:hypothetical protein
MFQINLHDELHILWSGFGRSAISRSRGRPKTISALKKVSITSAFLFSKDLWPQYDLCLEYLLLKHLQCGMCRGWCMSRRVACLILDELRTLPCCWWLTEGMILSLRYLTSGHIRYCKKYHSFGCYKCIFLLTCLWIWIHRQWFMSLSELRTTKLILASLLMYLKTSRLWSLKFLLFILW